MWVVTEVNKPSVDGERGRQEQSIERREVEALPEIRAGDHQQRRAMRFAVRRR